MERCAICGRPLDVSDDLMSADTGGDCWGCIGKIEADMGSPMSLDFVAKEIADRLRFEDGTPKPPAP